MEGPDFRKECKVTSLYETQRVNFSRIVKKYNEYLSLYKFVNRGSTEGASGFAEFYWRTVYFSRYGEGITQNERGY
jgi:hypothetical protein